MATTTKSTTSTSLSSAEVSYSDLVQGSYSISGGTLSDGGIQARLLCSPAGSNTYYSDYRDAKNVLHIDMTKQVNMT